MKYAEPVQEEIEVSHMAFHEAMELIADVDTKGDSLDVLSDYPAILVRLAVVWHPNTYLSTITKLTEDHARSVQEDALKQLDLRKAASPSLLQRIINYIKG